MRSIFKQSKILGDDLLASELYSNESFYKAFLNDLRCAEHEVIIESPFITSRRINTLYPELQRLLNHDVRITINTRDPIEHENDSLRAQAEVAIIRSQAMGIQVLFTVNHHRKWRVADVVLI